MQKLHGLDSIGNTPVVELRRLVPNGHARIFVKVEGQNPTGSMKDRMALSVVDRAAESGRLAPSGTVVEYSRVQSSTQAAVRERHWRSSARHADIEWLRMRRAVKEAQVKS